MANYLCAVRTNYFRVKNEDAFRNFMAHVQGSEDSVSIFERQSDEGEKLFGFGLFSTILGYVEEGEEDIDCENAYDAFLAGLQQHVAENDAVIIMEAGNEKLRYVIGKATIITSQSTFDIDSTQAAIEKAREMLGEKTWCTECYY